jgi:hypothetical protein
MKDLKILILFIIVFSGCSNKYLESSEEGPIGREWSVLEARIVAENEENISLNLQINDFVEVLDSIDSNVEFRLDNNKRKNVVDIKRILTGCTLGVSTILASAWSFLSYCNDPSGTSEYLWGCIALGGGILSSYFILDGFSPYDKFMPVDSYYTHRNQKCIGSEMLFYGMVQVLTENSEFEKTYYTDANGNVELKLEEILPKTTDADSVLNLIIKYKKMADTIKVRRS